MKREKPVTKYSRPRTWKTKEKNPCLRLCLRTPRSTNGWDRESDSRWVPVLGPAPPCYGICTSPSLVVFCAALSPLPSNPLPAGGEKGKRASHSSHDDESFVIHSKCPFSRGIRRVSVFFLCENVDARSCVVWCLVIYIAFVLAMCCVVLCNIILFLHNTF